MIRFFLPFAILASEKLADYRWYVISLVYLLSAFCSTLVTTFFFICISNFLHLSRKHTLAARGRGCALDWKSILCIKFEFNTLRIWLTNRLTRPLTISFCPFVFLTLCFNWQFEFFVVFVVMSKWDHRGGILSSSLEVTKIPFVKAKKQWKRKG